MNTGPAIVEAQRTLTVSTANLKSRLRKHLQFPSRLVKEKHDLVVYIPPMYDADPGRRYPVLFMQDGQNLFDPETAFVKGNHWRLGETADELIAASEIQPLIIVGIYNTGVRRIDEYTPTEDSRLGGGQADAYGRMLVEELKPFIDNTYSTLPGAENCGLGGSSLGGLVSLYLGLRYSSIFGKLAVMSPSVWWDKRAILATIAQVEKRPDLKIWLDIGTKESKRAVPDARALEKCLIRKGWTLDEDLAYTEVLGAEHNELAWAQRVEPMLKFLFPSIAYS